MHRSESPDTFGLLTTETQVGGNSDWLSVGNNQKPLLRIQILNTSLLKPPLLTKAMASNHFSEARQ